MDVVMVCESAELKGGAEKVAIAEALELKKRGFRVGFFAAGTDCDPRLKEAGIEVGLIDTLSFFEETDRKLKIQKLSSNPETVIEFGPFLDRFDPGKTVVHFHSFSLKLSNSAPKIAQDRGFKTIAHCHDYTSACPTALLYNHRKGQNCSLKPLGTRCFLCECQGQKWRYKIPKFVAQVGAKEAYDRMDAYIHISRLEREVLEPLLPSRAVHFDISNPMDLLRRNRVDATKNSNVISVSRLVPEKGNRLFLEAFPTGQIVGDGPERLRLETDFPGAEFLGWKSEPDVIELISQARVLVVPSVWRETFALNVIVAMSMGIPVLLADTVGAKEFFVDGKSGLTFRAGDIEDLKAKIKLLENNSIIDTLSREGYSAIWRNPPTIEWHCDRLIELYEKLIGASRSTSRVAGVA
jgi:glycosyltransferase involved in cell wall biosynthesis